MREDKRELHAFVAPEAEPDELVVRLGLYCRGYLYSRRPVEFLSHGSQHWVLFGNREDVPTGNSNGGLVDRIRRMKASTLPRSLRRS